MIEHQWEAGGLLRRHVGCVTAADIQASDSGLHADPRFRAVAYLIEDLRGCTGLLGVDAASLRRSAGAHAPFLDWPDRFQHAWIAREATPALSELATDEKAATLRRRLRMFRFIADARDWLSAELAVTVEADDGH